eukprot:2835504-Rhodomonas_salina.4
MDCTGQREFDLLYQEALQVHICLRLLYSLSGTEVSVWSIRVLQCPYGASSPVLNRVELAAWC